MTSLNDFEREFLINRDISTPTIFDYVSLICAGYAILRYKTTEEIKLVFSDDSCVVVIITLILRLMFGILFTSKDNFYNIGQKLYDLDMYVAYVYNHLEGWSMGLSLNITY